MTSDVGGKIFASFHVGQDAEAIQPYLVFQGACLLWFLCTENLSKAIKYCAEKCHSLELPKLEYQTQNSDFSCVTELLLQVWRRCCLRHAQVEIRRRILTEG